jgi:hypothetical protein
MTGPFLRQLFQSAKVAHNDHAGDEMMPPSLGATTAAPSCRRRVPIPTRCAVNYPDFLIRDCETCAALVC